MYFVMFKNNLIFDGINDLETAQDVLTRCQQSAPVVDSTDLTGDEDTEISGIFRMPVGLKAVKPLEPIAA